MSDLVLTGGTYSPDFYRSDGAYAAATAVTWQTPEQARADWSRTLQPAVMGCLAADLQAESTKQLKVLITGRRQLAWPTFGERSVAYRISLVLQARTKVRKKWRRVSTRATADFIAVGACRAVLRRAPHETHARYRPGGGVAGRRRCCDQPCPDTPLSRPLFRCGCPASADL